MDIERKMFQAEGRARAKLQVKHAWHARERARRPAWLKWDEQLGERLEMRSYRGSDEAGSYRPFQVIGLVL